jgi:ribosomal silencing factor RsfS
MHRKVHSWIRSLNQQNRNQNVIKIEVEGFRNRNITLVSNMKCLIILFMDLTFSFYIIEKYKMNIFKMATFIKLSVTET